MAEIRRGEVRGNEVRRGEVRRGEVRKVTLHIAPQFYVPIVTEGSSCFDLGSGPIN